MAAVRAVEAAGEEATARFGIAPHEVSRRRRLVQEVGDEVEEMREELARQVDVAAVGAAGGKKAGASSDLPDPSSFAVPDGRDDDVSNEDYAAEFERQQQLQMMREQDQHLDGVFQTVGNLRRQADDMGRELEEQVEMLDGVDRLADRVGGRLQTGVEKLRHVMRRNEDRFSSWCIGLLIVVLIVLLVLLLVL